MALRSFDWINVPFPLLCYFFLYFLVKEDILSFSFIVTLKFSGGEIGTNGMHISLLFNDLGIYFCEWVAYSMSQAMLRKCYWILKGQQNAVLIWIGTPCMSFTDWNFWIIFQWNSRVNEKDALVSSHWILTILSLKLTTF